MRHRPDAAGLRHRWAAFMSDQRGASAVMLAISFPVLVGGLALGAEAGYWLLVQRELQQAADVGAHAAAVKKRSGANADQMRAAAVKVSGASGFDAATDQLTMAAPPGTGAFAGDPDSVEVSITREQKRYFTMIYDPAPVTISARGVAQVREGATACLLALSPSAPGAISVSGSAEVVFDGCDVVSNSNASDSFLMSGGSATLTGGCLNTVGGAVVTAGLTLSKCPSVRENAPAAADPYSDIEEPEITGSCHDGSVGTPSGTSTLTPAETHPSGVPSMRFCSGLNLSGTVTLDPGLYLIEGGDFRINSNATISGEGVTFFLADGVEITFNGSATTNLSAPSSGPYAGLLMYGSRSASEMEHKLNGTPDSELEGAIYTPASDIDFTGNFTGDTSGCTQLVASTILFSGNSSLRVDCEGASVRPIKVRETVVLVE